MDLKEKPDGWWTLERCVKSASEYRSRSTEWQAEEGGAYAAACRYGWLEECVAHMPPPTRGIKPYEPARLYYVRLDIPGEETFYKIGITSREDVKQQFTVTRDYVTVLMERDYPTAAEARKAETLVLNDPGSAPFRWEGRAVMGTDYGDTELFTRDVLGLDELANFTASELELLE